MLKKIKSVRLENFCQYTSRTFKFPAGAVGLIGPNGSGKSNLLLAIYAGFTGDFSRIHPKKEDCIRQLSDASESAFIEIEAEYSGGTFVITRDLRSGRSKLTSSDGTILTATKEINAQIQAYLGLSPLMLADYVFVEQGRLCEFLSYTPAARANAFSTLCRTDFCETLWKLLGEALSEDRSLVYAFDQDQLRSLKADVKRLTRDRKRHAADVRVSRLSKKERERAREAEAYVENYKAEVEQASKLEATREKLEKEKKLVDTLQEEVKEAEEALKQLEERYASQKEEAFEANRMLRESTTILRKVEKRNTLERRLKKTKKTKAGLVAPTIEQFSLDGVKPREELIDLRAGLRSAYSQRAESLETLEDGDGACPTCNQVIEDKEQLVAHIQEEMSSFKDAMANMTEGIDLWDSYHEAIKDFDAEKAKLAIQISELNTDLAPLKDVPEINEDDIENWSTIVDEFDRLDKKLTSDRSDTQDLRSQLRVAEATVKALMEQIKELEEGQPKVEISSRVYKESRQFLREVRERRDQYMAAKKAHTLTADSLELAEERLQRAQDRKTKLAKASTWVDTLESAREVFHRDNLPRAVSQSYLTELEGEINRNLAAFGTPFRVDSCEDLQLLCSFPDGCSHYGDRLSGGLQVVLAIAFRFAVYSIFAPELGTMVLDEPTVFLDYDNVDYLRDALVGMNAKMREQDRQVLVVTHEDRLMNAFDTVFKL